MLQPTDEFFDTSAFAQEADYTAGDGGTPTTILIIYDAPYSRTETVDGIPVQNVSPLATCKSTDVEAAEVGGTLTIGAVTYRIAEIQPNGTGITTLVLSKDNPLA